MVVTGGNVNDTTMMTAVLEDIRMPRAGKGRPRTRADWVLADKGYPSMANRAWLRDRGIAATIPERDDRIAHRSKKQGRDQPRRHADLDQDGPVPVRPEHEPDGTARMRQDAAMSSYVRPLANAPVFRDAGGAVITTGIGGTVASGGHLLGRHTSRAVRAALRPAFHDVVCAVRIRPIDPKCA